VPKKTKGGGATQDLRKAANGDPRLVLYIARWGQEEGRGILPDQEENHAVKGKRIKGMGGSASDEFYVFTALLKTRRGESAA